MCINIAIGREASTDNQIMVCRNEDGRGHRWNRYLAYRSEPEYASPLVVHEGIWTLGNGLGVPLPANGFAYSAMPDAQPHRAARCHLHEGRGINENNVAVSTTNARRLNPQAMAADPLLAEAGVAEAVIPTLLLPQALSAHHGVELLGHYIERYGASEACGAILADAFEAWYLEIGSAHHWIAVRIPADSYLVAAGTMRVHDVDLDGAGVLHSRGLFEFVAEHRLLTDPDRRRFDFAAAFGVPGSPQDAERIWLTQKHLSSSRRQGPRQPRYPLFLKPDGRLCVTDVMTVLRGTSMWRVFEGGTGRPSAHDRTEASHIVCLNADMPTELRGLIWQTLGSPLGTPYLPLYHAMQDIPRLPGLPRPPCAGRRRSARASLRTAGHVACPGAGVRLPAAPPEADAALHVPAIAAERPRLRPALQHRLHPADGGKGPPRTPAPDGAPPGKDRQRVGGLRGTANRAARLRPVETQARRPVSRPAPQPVGITGLRPGTF